MSLKTFNCLVKASMCLYIFALTGCSDASAEPSDGVIVDCILDAADYPALGQERKDIVMGMKIGSSLIDEISIYNVIPEGEQQWVVYSLLKVGSISVGTTAEDTAATARMFGWEQKNGYLFQEIEAAYLFQAGGRGWSCFEI